MRFRHESKLRISPADLLLLQQRLSAVMQRDTHAAGDTYHIRSLYFDSPGDDALMDKINGVNRREKYRIRCYNLDFSRIFLEKKCKISGLSSKQRAEISAVQVQKILDSDLDWMLSSDQPLFTELYSAMQARQFRPKTIVDYTREPFIYEPGNVRVTLDYDIRTGLSGTDFFDPSCVTIPAGESVMILEVKWDEFLPNIIRDIIALDSRQVTAFSKYAQCRIYG